MTAKKRTPKAAARTSATGKKPQKFTADERAAMNEHLAEKAGKGEGESAALAKIAAMREPDRTMATRLHEIVKASAPALLPRLWYNHLQ